MISVRTTAFDGPMDLLLRLVEKAEVDIMDIPIAQITEEYLAVIATMDMEQTSEFIILAATLLEIKSKMLLFGKKADIEDDPREELAERLLAYKEAQEAANELRLRVPIGESVRHSGDKETLHLLNAAPALDLSGLDISLLSGVFAEVMRRREDRVDKVRAGFGALPKEVHSLTEKVALIVEILRRNRRLSLSKLFEKCRSKYEMVVTFLAVLELARRGHITARQSENFGDVEVLPCSA